MLSENERRELETSRDNWMALSIVLAAVLGFFVLGWWFRDCENLLDEENLVIGYRCFDRPMRLYDFVIVGLVLVTIGVFRLYKRVRKQNWNIFSERI
jgi:hypothetical protein